jgi:hypothetical protein
MSPRVPLSLITFAALVGSLLVSPVAVSAGQPTYDITTLTGKVASLNGTAGLQVRFSAFIEQEAEPDVAPPEPTAPITPTFVLSSPLDGSSVAPNVTVNQDTAAAPQNETAIAVDPNNAHRVVAAANDHVARTWACTISGTPCSALGDGYSGTYVSNDGGATWCCSSSDPALAFDSRGHVYYAGLGFDRTAAPNTVAVNRGTFDSSGNLSWGAPTFVNPTKSPSTLNDKEWIGADWHVSSPFRDRVYVSWTRFIFNANNGRYVQSSIFFAYSTDGGATFSAPTSISGNVLYDQGSRVVVGYDGTVNVFFEGATRLASLDSTYMAKSTDGGVTFSKPVAVASLQDIVPPANTLFRVNSFPAADAAPNGDLYVAWSSQMRDAGGLCPSGTNAGCHAAALYSKSTDGGATWNTPAPIFPALDLSTWTAIGYPVTQPGGGTLNAPAARPVDTFWPAVAISPSGKVYMSAYGADVVSPWQTCAAGPPPPEGRINCTTLGNYVHNARLDYFVVNIGVGTIQKVSSNPINSQNGFGGGFIGDYTGLAVGSDDVFHALWTDTNNKQTVTWFYFYGSQFVPTLINQEDVVTASGSF